MAAHGFELLSDAARLQIGNAQPLRLSVKIPGQRISPRNGFGRFFSRSRRPRPPGGCGSLSPAMGRAGSSVPETKPPLLALSVSESTRPRLDRRLQQIGRALDSLEVGIAQSAGIVQPV